MKRIKIVCLSLILFSFSACAQAQDDDHAFAKLPKPAANEKVANFAGGCFWALTEAMSELKGVTKVVAGYSGGNAPNPTYEDVCTKTTGHAETVQVYYDPGIITYSELAQAFFYSHDPTELNRQGPDEGTDYRSIAYYRTPEEKKELEDVMFKVSESHHYKGKIVTEVQPFKIMYAAENYHQGYYKLHPNQPYILMVSRPKVMKLRKALPALLKPEFQNKS